ncbi:WAT1-related protein At4g08290-like [Apium graveolens]|uniref:WAT1-related protein At4g08290-like n=1 Tax=Apium graveolens TaxID=4045 RepID=UPI003D7B482B
MGMENLQSGYNKAKPYLLMVVVQSGAAGMYLISSVVLKQGMSRYVLVVYRNAVGALVLAPFAIFLERKIRPKMTLSVFFQIMALAILEPVLDQNFSYLGMSLTSASYTSAIMNAVPAVTFIVAVLLRLERLKMREMASQAKVFGTIVTFGGALIMTVFKGPIVNLIWSPKQSLFDTGTAAASSDQHWLSGTVFILIGCIAWALFFVLQSITLKKYPAEISLAFLICLMGAVLSAAVTLVAEAHHPDVWAVGWNSKLLAPAFAGVVTSGLTYYIQGVVLQTRGPVFVTAFNPLCMIIVAVLGSIVLAEKLHLGAIIGAIVIAVGLYAVVWGKGKDKASPSDEIANHQLPMTKMDTAHFNVSGDTNTQKYAAAY